MTTQLDRKAQRKLRQRELAAEVGRMRLELELLSAQLSKANEELGHQSFLYAKQHLDAVWRSCEYAIQCLGAPE